MAITILIDAYLLYIFSRCRGRPEVIGQPMDWRARFVLQ